MQDFLRVSVEIGNKFRLSGNQLYRLTPHTPFKREGGLKGPAPQPTVQARKGVPITLEQSSEEDRAGSHFMKNLDLQVVQQATTWLEQDRCVWLCTVLATFGSAPRGPGSVLAALSTGGALQGGPRVVRHITPGTKARHNEGDSGVTVPVVVEADQVRIRMGVAQRLSIAALSPRGPDCPRSHGG